VVDAIVKFITILPPILEDPTDRNLSEARWVRSNERMALQTYMHFCHHRRTMLVPCGSCSLDVALRQGWHPCTLMPRFAFVPRLQHCWRGESYE